MGSLVGGVEHQHSPTTAGLSRAVPFCWNETSDVRVIVDMRAASGVSQEPSEAGAPSTWNAMIAVVNAEAG